MKPGHVRVVADEPLALAGDRVDGAGDLGLLGQAVDERDHPLLVGDRDVRAEEVVAADLGDRVGQGDRRPVPELVGGVDALVVERGLLHRARQRVGDGMADEDDALGHDANPSEVVEEAGIGDRGAAGPEDGRPAGGDEAGDGEGHRQAMVVEAVGRSAPRERRAAVDPEVVAVDVDLERRAPRRPSADAGDPVGLLVAKLAGAADRRRAPRPGSRRGRGSGSRRSPRRRRPARGRSPAASDERTRRSAIGSPTPSSRSAPAVAVDRPLLDVGAHRPEEVDDRPPGRVDADAAERQLGVRDGSRRRRARRRPPTRRPEPARRSPPPSRPPSRLIATPVRRRVAGAVAPIGPRSPRARSIRSV